MRFFINVKEKVGMESLVYYLGFLEGFDIRVNFKILLVSLCYERKGWFKGNIVLL